MLPFPVSAVLTVVGVLFYIVTQVAFLAQSGKVFKNVVCFVMINMRHGKYYYATRFRVWFIVLSPAPLAFVFCTVKANKLADKPPFWMVIFIVYWHR